MNNTFEVGDSISFLDQKLDGVIIRIEKNGNLLIETSDGFEISARPAEIIIKSKVQKTSETEPPKIPPTPFSDDSIAGFVKEGAVSILTQAHEPNKVLTGMVRLVLVNNTPMGLYYTLHKNNKQASQLSHGNIEPMSEKVLLDYSRENWFGNQELNFMAIFYNTNSGPVSAKRELKIKIPGLSDISTSQNDGQIFATEIPIYSSQQVDNLDFEKLIDKFKPEESRTTQIRPQRFTSGPSSLDQYLRNENVIDLHIEELIEDFAGLDAQTMLKIQLDVFEKELNRAIQEKSYNIIFIHGVGKKVLKNAIIQQLRKYSGLNWRDADPLRFGSGATEVLMDALV